MKLQMLSFQDDGILARRIKEESNYCDPAHLYSATFGISRVVLWELSPIDLDGCGRLTVCANVEQELSWCAVPRVRCLYQSGWRSCPATVTA